MAAESVGTKSVYASARVRMQESEQWTLI